MQLRRKECPCLLHTDIVRRNYESYMNIMYVYIYIDIDRSIDHSDLLVIMGPYEINGVFVAAWRLCLVIGEGICTAMM